MTPQYIQWTMAREIFESNSVRTSAEKMSRLKTRNPKTGTLANSEDQDEMPHYTAFHQGLHCLLRQNQYSENEICIF